MRLFYVVSITLGLLTFSCKQATDKVKEDFKPLAGGEADEIILVIDSAQWEGKVGDLVKDMFDDYILGLPQDEKEFALRKVNPMKLNSVLRSARNMIFVMTLDSKSRQSRTIREYFTDQSLKMIQKDSSLFYTVRRDEFAKGQIVLYLFGQDEENLIENIKDNRSRLVELFESAVRERTRDKILKKTKKQLMKAIQEKHNYSIEIPFGWDLAKNLPNFVWLRRLEAESELNIFIYKEPYEDQNVFNNVDKLRDRITETYLRDSENPEIYINRQEIIPVFTERVTFDGNFAVEGRGLWKISDSSGGGPFVSYTMVDEETQMLYYIEGYVYSPGTKKKDLMREVEAILSTFKVSGRSSEPQ